MKRVAKIVVLVLIVAAIGCSKEKKEKTGKVKVAFENDTSMGLALAELPSGSTGVIVENGSSYVTYPATTYASKMVMIYLNEDVGANGWDNVGEIGNVWINPACATYTDDSGVTRIGNNGACDTTKIETFFEFARPTEEVNAELNSQHLVIPTGTYRYARVQVCDNQIPDDNVKWTSVPGGLTQTATGRTGNCVMNPVKIEPALEIGDGDSATVSLEYDLSKGILDLLYDVESNTYKSPDSNGTPKYCAVPQTGQGLRCVGGIPFIATVKK